MSKRAEEAALKSYPKKDYNKEPNYLHTCDSEMLDIVYRDVFMLGYKQAEKDLGWISVNDRLPEERKYESDNLQGHHEWTESDEVFVLDDRGFPMVDSLRNGKFRYDGHKDCDGFPHWIEYWMPIPELPKEDD